MADKSLIEWTDATWNPVRGCTRVSPGCGGPGPHGGCYAEAVAARFSGPGQPYEGLAERRGGKPRWTGRLSFGHNLDAPLRWRRPRRIFVNSMSDLFHEALSVEEIATVFAVCVAAHHLHGHTFQILTKRSARMREVLALEVFWHQVDAEAGAHVMDSTDPLARRSDDARATLREYGPKDPPPGIWLGISAEDQQRADERVPDLLATPAAVRFVSAEPLLGPIDFTFMHDPDLGQKEPWPHHVNALTGECSDEENGTIDGMFEPGQAPKLDWIIVGGENGPTARPMHPAWARSIRDQCAAAGTAFFFKQWGMTAPLARALPVEDSPYDNVAWPDGTIGPGRASERGGHGTQLFRGSKSVTGRLLDGIEHNAMPGAL